MVKVVYGKGSSHEEIFWTGTVADYPGIDALNPMFDAAFHVPLTTEMLEFEVRGNGVTTQQSKASSSETSLESPSRSKRHSLIGMVSKSFTVRRSSFIEMTLIDGGSNGSKGHGELGTICISRQDLVDAHNHTIIDTREIGIAGARLEFKIFLSGVQSQHDTSDDGMCEMDDSERQDLEGVIGEKEAKTMMLTALRGRGFEIQKRGFGKKDDVPDIYLYIPLFHWKTSVVKDDTMPQWNESKLFTTTNISRPLRVDAYHKNSKTKDVYIGTATFPLDQLLRKRTLELELMNASKPTHSYVTMQGMMRSAQDNDTTNGDVLIPSLSASAPPSFSPFNLDLGESPDDEHTVDSDMSMSSNRRRMFRSSSLRSPKAIARSVTSFKRTKSKYNELNGSIPTVATIQE